MRPLDRESRVLAAALDQIRAAYPIRITHLRRTVSEKERGWDGQVTLKTKQGAFQYVYEAKAHLRPESVRHLLIRARIDRAKWRKATELLLLADYVNPSLAAQLKEAGINFVDTAGNLFLSRDPGLYLYVEGKKPPASQKDKPARLFQPSGLTLLFGLLIEPDSINTPYRHLSNANGVALGTVGWVKRDLKEQGYLEPLGNERFRLLRKKELVERWVQGYASRLRPKLFLGEFRELTNDLDAVVKSFQHYALDQGLSWGLTGGFGADELVHHYRSNVLTVFIELWRQDDALRTLKWLPVTGGPITVIKAFSSNVFRFWGKQEPYPVVHPLLVYAELLCRATDRDLETARLIYHKYLEPTLAKD
ncbi:MAG: type IV toxin-antitoxin system AbiEi family antitoxin [Nitrospiraceae bacterium]